MKKDDVEFIKALKHEMLTQDTVCQADPRFWVVMQTEKEYWVDENTDGIFVYSASSAETVYEGELDGLVKWLKTLKGVKKCRYDVCYVEFIYKGDEYSIGTATDLQDFLKEYDKDNSYNVGYYREREEICKDTMFLTLRECREHLKFNAHHYNNTAHPYAMTAWRSPQVERLYNIIQKTDWDKFVVAP